MVINAIDRFAARTADMCATLDPKEIETRSAEWPPGYDDLVAKHIEARLVKASESRAS